MSRTTAGTSKVNRAGVTHFSTLRAPPYMRGGGQAITSLPAAVSSDTALRGAWSAQAWQHITPVVRSLCCPWVALSTSATGRVTLVPVLAAPAGASTTSDVQTLSFLGNSIPKGPICQSCFQLATRRHLRQCFITPSATLTRSQPLGHHIYDHHLDRDPDVHCYRGSTSTRPGWRHCLTGFTSAPSSSLFSTSVGAFRRAAPASAASLASAPAAMSIALRPGVTCLAPPARPSSTSRPPSSSHVDSCGVAPPAPRGVAEYPGSSSSNESHSRVAGSISCRTAAITCRSNSSNSCNGADGSHWRVPGGDCSSSSSNRSKGAIHHLYLDTHAPAPGNTAVLQSCHAPTCVLERPPPPAPSPRKSPPAISTNDIATVATTNSRVTRTSIGRGSALDFQPLAQTLGEQEEEEEGLLRPRLPPPHCAVAAWRWGEEPGASDEAGNSRGRKRLDPGQVQIWWTPLDPASTCCPAAVERYGSCLSASEAEDMRSGLSGNGGGGAGGAGGADASAGGGGGGGGSRAACSEAVMSRRTAARALARCVLTRAIEAAAEVEEGEQDGGSVEAVATEVATCKRCGGHGCGDGGTSCGSPSRPVVVLPQDLEFHRNAHGKPQLVHRHGWPRLHHNLTHTHDLAGVAVFRQPVSRNQTRADHGSAAGAAAGNSGPVLVSYGIGLDVERLDRVPRDPLALARRWLAAAEVRDLEALTGEDRIRHFMCLWTLKEAYVKARGTGISAPPGLRGFEIGFADTPADRVRDLAAVCGGSYRVVPGFRTITLQHTAPTGVAAAACTATATAGRTKRTAADCSRHPYGIGVSDECLFEGPDTHFSFVLFQPTPRHVAALCLAVHPASAALPLTRGSQTGCNLDVAASTDRSYLEKGRSGLLPIQAVQGMGQVVQERQQLAVGQEFLPYGESHCLMGGEDRRLLLHQSHLAVLAENWWCMPLVAEGKLGGEQLTLLGASW